MPKRIARWNPARDVWEGQTTGLFCEHLDVYSETFVSSGMTRNGVAYQLPPWEPRTADTESSLLLPTPEANTGSNGGSQHPDKRRAGGHSVNLQDVAEHLLPTPMARDHKAAGPADGNRKSPNLSAIDALLPTPRATDGTKGGPNQRGSSGDLMLPSAVMLLPTPSVADGMGGHRSRSGNRSSELLLPGAVLELNDLSE